METQLKPLHNDATSGAGKILTVPDPERIVRFIIRSKGPVTGGEVTFECYPMNAVPQISPNIVWRAMKTVHVPTDIFSVTGYYAGNFSGMFRARISTPISG